MSKSKARNPEWPLDYFNEDGHYNLNRKCYENDACESYLNKRRGMLFKKAIYEESPTSRRARRTKQNAKIDPNR